MKRLTLNETWKLCLSMWRWIAKQIKAGSEKDIETLKGEWLSKHWSEEIIDACFFCEYAVQHAKKAKAKFICRLCPAVKIDKSFSCTNDGYEYDCEPIAFYKKLVSLNKKRKKK